MKLIKLGAVIMGKTKMTSFASPEEPTDQWVDFHCLVNPRGDRYQSPSSGSTGAGTSLAGYNWLNFSIAGDCKLIPLLSPPISYTEYSTTQLQEAFEHPRHAVGSFLCDLASDLPR